MIYYNFRLLEKVLCKFVIFIYICKFVQLCNVLYVLNVFRFDDFGIYCCRLYNGKGDIQVYFSGELVVVVKSRLLKKVGYEEGKRYNNSIICLWFFYFFLISFKIIILYMY